MRAASVAADLQRVQARRLLAVLVGLLSTVAFVGAATTATAGRACLSGDSDGGYSYAGHQAASRGHGVRATIALTREPRVGAGHVAGWVGIGGPGQGANGGDAWIQAGIAALPALGTVLYSEIKREGQEPKLVLVHRRVTVGQSYGVAVLEVAGLPGWWQVWIDGEPVTERVRIPGSSGRWAPIVTAESWNGGTPTCNAFGFRFERVSVSRGGGSWRRFVSGHRFLDGTHTLRDLHGSAAAATTFVAASTS
jgi:hypothetical protein